MKIYRKTFLLTVLVLLLSGSLFAQEFKTHAVKQGETLESIAKQYKVSQESILKLNREIQRGGAVKANTILVIPVSGEPVTNVVSVHSLLQEITGKETAEKQKVPVGFYTHKTRRKETLYGISKKYKVSEDDLKRYNTELYSIQLKKGMELRIPKFRRETSKERQIDEADYEIYTVQPKETRWSIAHKYGITIDSLLVLNPVLSKTSNYIAGGQQLLLPKIGSEGTKVQNPQKFIWYTVPAKQTFYSLEKKFGIASKDIIALNPEIKERGGLKEGMVLRIPEKSSETAAGVTTENFIFYEVKAKETQFSLSRKLGIGYSELLALNPDLKDGLKEGMVLKLPKTQMGDFDVRNALILDKISLLDSIRSGNRAKLLFLLPFRLDRLNVNDKESTMLAIENRKDVNYSLGLYSGAMVALDSIAKLGVSVDVKTIDTQLDATHVRGVLQRENLNGVSAVFGPLEPKMLNEVAAQVASYNIPVIAPLADGAAQSPANVFFAMPSEKVLREQMLAYISRVKTDENIIIIADQKNKGIEQTLISKFPQAKTVDLKDDRTLSIDKLNQLFVLDRENWVFLETDQANLVYHVGSVLNSSISKDVKLRLFTTNKNKAFDAEVVSYSHLSNLRFTYPSASREVAANGFVAAYKKRFGAEPDAFAVRGFDLTMDILLKIAYKNDYIGATNSVGETSYTGNKFNFVKEFNAGYSNKGGYILGFDKMRIVEIKE
ncbi:LysM repeat-containing protein [Arenibacter nanhaiticus]|uniref:LysM repeat-containing protein n=1 Tax=Arenibacter nanhaiticus TaxID=558155 RepID=A0A1M6B996_9FLAO|nr:LysM peptidoglycan-binding domain-containing protein [Arenibacter nanhaiticus]SHI45310.1 LysM repeat-containing protein [Arenibacter nanhaiticus]